MFRQILQGIVEETHGGIGAALMGYDGIAIEQYFQPCDDVDLSLLAVEYANVLKEVRNTVDILGTGNMEEVSIRTGKYYVVIRALTSEYFILMAVDGEGNFGKARYMLLREAPSLREALR